MLLNLNVNQRHEATRAHQELLHAAKVLTPQALKMPLPNAAEREILRHTMAEHSRRTPTSVLTHDNWSTGKECDLKFLVRPMGQTRQCRALVTSSPLQRCT